MRDFNYNLAEKQLLKLFSIDKVNGEKLTSKLTGVRVQRRKGWICGQMPSELKTLYCFIIKNKKFKKPTFSQIIYLVFKKY